MVRKSYTKEKNHTLALRLGWIVKTSFYFTEKHLEAIAALDISERKKEEFAGMKPTGKLIPMTFDISEKEQLDELLTLVRFKKSLK